jgi:hypothetical protein
MSTVGFLFSVCVSVAVAGSLVGACSGPQTRGPNIKAGDMPAGEEWRGVYFNEIFGMLHLDEQGDNIVGAWRRKDGSKWGELNGTKQGNLLHYSWSEYTVGQPNVPAFTSKGKGYFVYAMGSENIPVIKGEYGVNDNESGARWDCVKQQGMHADPTSVKGDIPGHTSSGTGWN